LLRFCRLGQQDLRDRRPGQIFHFDQRRLGGDGRRRGCLAAALDQDCDLDFAVAIIAIAAGIAPVDGRPDAGDFVDASTGHLQRNREKISYQF
jgi:hypothetical protein